MSEQPRKLIDTRDKPGLLFAMMRKFAINSHMSKVIKEILFRTAERTAVPVMLAGNRLLHTLSWPYISALQVADGFDVADSEIVKRL